MKEVFINRRILHLRSRGHQCDVHFLGKKYSASYALLQRILGVDDAEGLPEDITKDGIKWTGFIHRFGFPESLKRRIDPMGFQKRFCQDIAEQILDTVDFSKYDIIHCHVPHPEGYIGTILSDRTGLPLVVSCYGSDIHTCPRLDPVVKAMTVSAISRADKAIFTSNYLLEAAKGLGYVGENAAVIPVGVDSGNFTILDRQESKKRLGLSGDVTGFVGNLIEVKRADALPEIFRDISAKRDGMEFLIVGDGGLRAPIAKLMSAFGLKAKFTGAVAPAEVTSYMNAMDVLVLPSRNEGWGCVVVEAQACGVPVVGSDRGGIPEAVGEGGIIVPDGEGFEERFAKAVVEALNRTWDREALRNRAKKFDWNETIQREIEVYQSLIK
ncbi:MAG: glycosyltransferase [Methanobacteriota archaeon]